MSRKDGAFKSCLFNHCSELLRNLFIYSVTNVFEPEDLPNKKIVVSVESLVIFYFVTR